MRVVRNIDIVQINVESGVSEYYLPKNTDWAGKVVDKIIIAVPPSSCVSPIDGTTSLLTNVSNLYLDLYAADDTEICRNLYFTAVSDTNNNPLTIGRKLSANLSRLYFSVTPTTAGAILLYVYYNGDELESEMPTKSITVGFSLSASGKMSLRDIVDNYIHIQDYGVKGVLVWDAENNPAYFTLRTKDNKSTFNSVLTTLARPTVHASNSQNIQMRELVLDSVDVDMLNSYFQNATATANNQTVTFLY